MTWWDRTRGAWLTAGVVVVGTAVVAVRDPHVAGSYGVCPLVLATGLSCPACGGLRATHDLAHGDLAGAWGSNPLWVLLVPVLVVLWAWWLLRRSRGREARLPAWTAWVFLGLVLVFGVLRNVPALAVWLGP
ncbi:DUF2752 domain-containing protein [Cellulomonas sp. DKR-3]|uniref:DUF2752 domain-containing protein n=1 Tax=Cellulomonas fulva TaxID=2835530 RepID=A0ABS5U1E5_9CELL|nr:DUF2752 domain-containing protein [Cellulomonas fulva]